ncbi:MAG: hypothetical protein H6872_11135 [Methylobacteriaceae bacterium]|nr:hypothetical protein [Methylobacteriaceae bacterium]
MLTDAGVLALVRSKHQFQRVPARQFQTTDVRLVVTDCDQDERRDPNSTPRPPRA